MPLTIIDTRLFIGSSECDSLLLPIRIPNWLSFQQISKIEFKTVTHKYPGIFTYCLIGHPANNNCWLKVSRTDISSGWGQELQVDHNLRVIHDHWQGTISLKLDPEADIMDIYYITCPPHKSLHNKHTLDIQNHTHTYRSKLQIISSNWLEVYIIDKKKHSLILSYPDISVLTSIDNNMITSNIFKHGDKIYILNRPDHWKGKGIFCELIQSKLIELSQFNRPNAKLEDPRYIGITRDKLYVFLTCTWSDYNIKRMEVIYFNTNWKLVKQWLIPKINGITFNNWEKNWVPIISSNSKALGRYVSVVYSHSPLITVTLDLFNQVAILDKNNDKDTIVIDKNIRGSTPLLSYNNYYLCLIHNNKYNHRFIIYNQDLSVKCKSDWFRLFSKSSNVEFVTGIVPVDGRWLIAININETTCKILKIPYSVIDNLIKLNIDYQ
jgi:hypothetical protein